MERGSKAQRLVQFMQIFGRDPAGWPEEDAELAALTGWLEAFNLSPTQTLSGETLDQLKPRLIESSQRRQPASLALTTHPSQLGGMVFRKLLTLKQAYEVLDQNGRLHRARMLIYPPEEGAPAEKTLLGSSKLSGSKLSLEKFLSISTDVMLLVDANTRVWLTLFEAPDELAEWGIRWNITVQPDFTLPDWETFELPAGLEEQAELEKGLAAIIESGMSVIQGMAEFSGQGGVRAQRMVQFMQIVGRPPKAGIVDNEELPALAGWLSSAHKLTGAAALDQAKVAELRQALASHPPAAPGQVTAGVYVGKDDWATDVQMRAMLGARISRVPVIAGLLPHGESQEDLDLLDLFIVRLDDFLANHPNVKHLVIALELGGPFLNHLLARLGVPVGMLMAAAQRDPDGMNTVVRPAFEKAMEAVREMDEAMVNQVQAGRMPDLEDMDAWQARLLVHLVTKRKQGYEISFAEEQPTFEPWWQFMLALEKETEAARQSVDMTPAVQAQARDELTGANLEKMASSVTRDALHVEKVLIPRLMASLVLQPDVDLKTLAVVMPRGRMHRLPTTKLLKRYFGDVEVVLAEQLDPARMKLRPMEQFLEYVTEHEVDADQAPADIQQLVSDELEQMRREVTKRFPPAASSYEDLQFEDLAGLEELADVQKGIVRLVKDPLLIAAGAAELNARGSTLQRLVQFNIIAGREPAGWPENPSPSELVALAGWLAGQRIEPSAVLEQQVLPALRAVLAAKGRLIEPTLPPLPSTSSPLEIGGLWGARDVVYSPSIARIFISHEPSGQVLVFDPAGRPAGFEISVNNPGGLALNEKTGELLVLVGVLNPQLLSFDAQTGQPRGVKIANAGASPSKLVFDPARGQLFVVDRLDNRVRGYDSQTGQPTGFEITGLRSPYGIAYDPAGNRLFVTDVYSPYLLRAFDATTGQPTGFEIREGIFPEHQFYGLDYDPASGVLYVVARRKKITKEGGFSTTEDAELWRFDGTTGRPLGDRIKGHPEAYNVRLVPETGLVLLVGTHYLRAFRLADGQPAGFVPVPAAGLEEAYPFSPELRAIIEADYGSDRLAQMHRNIQEWLGSTSSLGAAEIRAIEQVFKAHIGHESPDVQEAARLTLAALAEADKRVRRPESPVGIGAWADLAKAGREEFAAQNSKFQRLVQFKQVMQRDPEGWSAEGESDELAAFAGWLAGREVNPGRVLDQSAAGQPTLEQLRQALPVFEQIKTAPPTVEQRLAYARQRLTDVQAELARWRSRTKRGSVAGRAVARTTVRNPTGNVIYEEDQYLDGMPPSPFKRYRILEYGIYLALQEEAKRLQDELRNASEAASAEWVDQTLRELADSIEGNHVLVLGPKEWEPRRALQELVRRAPERMLQQIIFFGVGAPLAEQLRQLRPDVTLKIVEERRLEALAQELAAYPEGSRISVFDHDLAETLRFISVGLSISVVELRPLSPLRLILAAMGVTEPALNRVDADLLEQALSRLASA